MKAFCFRFSELPVDNVMETGVSGFERVDLREMDVCEGVVGQSYCPDARVNDGSFARKTFIRNSVEALSGLDVVGADGVDCDVVVRCSAISAYDSPSEFTVEADEIVLFPPSANFGGDPSLRVGRSNYQMHAFVGFVELDVDEVRH